MAYNKIFLPIHALLLKCSHKPSLGDETCGDNSVIATTDHCYYNNRALLLQQQSTEHRYHNHAVNCPHMANLRCKNQVASAHKWQTLTGHFLPRPTCERLSIITGLDYWNGLLEWTTGLTFFALKIIFMVYNDFPASSCII